MTNQNFRIKEASTYVGVKPSTLWLYARQGKIHPVRLSPRVTIFLRSDLDAFINGATEAVVS